MKISEQQIEEIGLLRDKAENLLAAAKLPMPDSIHVSGLKHGLTEMQATLAELYKELTK